MRDQFVSLKQAAHYQGRAAFVASALSSIKNVAQSFKLLDVGNLGDGTARVDVRGIVESVGGEYWGLDVNENLARELGLKNQIIGDLHDLKGKVSDEEYDAIYAGEIIEHTWMPGMMIVECNRILKKDGILILDTPNVFSLINVLRVYLLKRDSVNMDDAEMVYHEAKDNFKEWRGSRGEVQSQPQHKILYGPAMMRQLMNMHGFAIEELAFIGSPDRAVYRLFLPLVPQGAQKLGMVAKKSSLDSIFKCIREFV